MICLRLTQEYQLIEDYDEQVSLYKKDKLQSYIAYINNDQSRSASANENITNTNSSAFMPLNIKNQVQLSTLQSSISSTATKSTPSSFLQRYPFNRVSNSQPSSSSTSSTVATGVKKSSPSTSLTTTSHIATSRLLEKHQNFFVLSMGHAIQFLQVRNSGVSLIFT